LREVLSLACFHAMGLGGGIAFPGDVVLEYFNQKPEV
jgi:hypothetical protein